MHLNLIKGMYDKLTGNTLNREKWKAFYFKLSNKKQIVLFKNGLKTLTDTSTKKI